MKTSVNTNTFFRQAITMVLVGIVISSSLFAGGDKFSPRLVGMGRTFTALSRGLDAVGTNPANLALNDRDATITLNIFSIGAAAGSDFINYKIYTDYFTGIPDPNNPGKRLPKPLDQKAKDEILGLFPEGLARTQANLGAGVVGLSFQSGNFGFAIVPSAEIVGNVDLPEGFLKFPLNGNSNEAFTKPINYSFDETALNASAVLGLNFSAGFILPIELPTISEISVGAGVKYLAGFAYVTTDHYKASLDVAGDTYTDANTGESYFLARKFKGEFDYLQFFAVDTTDNKPVGSGLGFDIGASALVLNSIRVGISVTDIGSMKWDKYTKAIISKSSFEIENLADSAQQETVAKAFKGKTVDTTAFSYSLPTALHIGAEMRVDEVLTVLPFRWTVAVDMHVGFNNVAGNSTLAQFAIGTELDPLAGWLPLRTGILLGGRDRFGWSAGFGIHLANTLDLDFATQSIALLTNPDSFRIGSAVVGMRLRF